MKNCLIGYSGYVGSTLLKQAKFESLYRSTNIHEIENDSEFDLVVCAGAPAQKWIANRNPEDDLSKINSLVDHLKKVKCKTFILISTVDVFKKPVDVNEESDVEESGLHPYGLHRRKLEKFVQEHFDNHLIVRLPGLVGPGLRKNIIFDALNENNIQAIESRNVFQFYPMVNLWIDIQHSINCGLKVIHLTAEPISVEEVFQLGFGMKFKQELSNSLVRYDMQTKYADLFGLKGNYLYNQRETVLAIRAYAQSEPMAAEKL